MKAVDRIRAAIPFLRGSYIYRGSAIDPGDGRNRYGWWAWDPYANRLMLFLGRSAKDVLHRWGRR